MHALVATGLPAVPAAGHAPFDWAPLVMVLAAVVVAPIVFGIRLTLRSIPVLVLGGIAAGWLAAAMGGLPAACVGLIGLSIASTRRPGSRRRGAPGIVELPD